VQQHALTERLALSETLRAAGPGSPTLCGGWTTTELAAHLVARERSVVEGAGRIPLPRLQQAAGRVVSDLAARPPYAELVDAVGRGPSWQPRDLPEAFHDAVWARLHLLARSPCAASPSGSCSRGPAAARSAANPRRWKMQRRGLLASGRMAVMAQSPSGFEFEHVRDEVVIFHQGRRATTLRGAAAVRFLADVEAGDAQELMARVTGNYKRGNERVAKTHARNRGR
jgi:hypothetical protein